MPDHRSCPRWQVNLQAKLKLEGRQESSLCILRDINFKGARVCLEERLTQDAPLKLSLWLSEDCRIEVEAWVAWRKGVEGLNTYGLYFTRIKETDREKIHQFMQSNFSSQMEKQIWGDLTKKEGGGRMEDQRIFERFAVAFPLRYLDVNKNKEGSARMQDISAKGLGFIANEELLPQTPLELWIEIPDKGEPLYARGEVAWSKLQDSKDYRIGVNLQKADLMGLSRILRVM